MFLAVAPPVEQSVLNLFAQVREAISRATWALLNGDLELGQTVVDGDQEVDELTAELELLIWSRIEEEDLDPVSLRQLIGYLLILPELERSADLAEHIAQRALSNVGTEMTPVTRWHRAENVRGGGRDVAVHRRGSPVGNDAGGLELHEADEELDILHDRLTNEIGTGRWRPR